MGQYDEALLRPSVQRDRLPRLHGIEGDKIAVRLSRTESLSVHTRVEIPVDSQSQPATLCGAGNDTGNDYAADRGQPRSCGSAAKAGLFKGRSHDVTVQACRSHRCGSVDP